MQPIKIGLALLFAIAAAGCGSGVSTTVLAGAEAPTRTPPPTKTPPSESVAEPGKDASLTRTDGQGAVVVEVTPVDLDTSGDLLVFDVSLNTHSVDLGMDLAPASTLTTDAGTSVGALEWDAPRGGHHVSGTLAFPASLDGKRVLSGTTKLTLTIKGVDAAERVFTWNLSP